MDKANPPSWRVLPVPRYADYPVSLPRTASWELTPQFQVIALLFLAPAVTAGQSEDIFREDWSSGRIDQERRRAASADGVAQIPRSPSQSIRTGCETTRLEPRHRYPIPACAALAAGRFLRKLHLQRSHGISSPTNFVARIED